MFQNRFEKFLKTYKDANGDATGSQIITIIEYDEIDAPKFDENFDLFNIPTSSSDAVSNSISDSQKRIKQPTVVETVQVLFYAFRIALITLM